MSTVRMRWLRAGATAVAVVLSAAALVGWLNVRGEESMDAQMTEAPGTPQLAERGAYLARAGNCMACHTARGGAAFAGGKGIATPFGVVYAGNLTPDATTGIGRWTSAEFWRALHHGRSKDGRLLYPAFPYPDYTVITRADSDALYAFLRSQPEVRQRNRPHELRFPYGSQWALAVWRALFFSPGEFRAEQHKSAEWNRGAYLVRGLGHCQACHAPRNALGATDQSLELSGGLIPMQNWYAPSLAAPAEAGVQDWQTEDIVRLLKTGHSPRGVAMGPMAEVVFSSTQHLSDADVRAMATFLKQLPRHTPSPAVAARATAQTLSAGAGLYKNHCAQCHGERGEGSGTAYPALAGHRTVTMGPSANLVRVIISGGFPATTEGNPRPFGMPPFGQRMTDVEIAAVASYVRGAWGNAAPAVSALDVQKLR